MPTMFNAHYEFEHPNLTDERAIEILEDLDGLHPAVGGTPGGRLSVRITFAAEDLKVAQKIGLESVVAAVAGRGLGVHAGAMPVVAEVMTEAEFDAREGFAHIPELVSAPEVAEMLGVSAARVRQMIEEGKFLTATRIGERGIAIARSEVETMVKRRQEMAAAISTDRAAGETDEEHVARITAQESSEYPKHA